MTLDAQSNNGVVGRSGVRSQTRQGGGRNPPPVVSPYCFAASLAAARDALSKRGVPNG